MKQFETQAPKLPPGSGRRWPHSQLILEKLVRYSLQNQPPKCREEHAYGWGIKEHAGIHLNKMGGREVT